MDDFIRRNLPRPSREEVEEADARVLSRLHRDMQDRINSFKLEESSPVSDLPEWLTRDIEWPEKPLAGPDYLVLRVVSLFGGEAYLCSIKDKVRELSPDIEDFLMIPVSLDRLLWRGYLRRGTHGFPPKGPRVAENLTKSRPPEHSRFKRRRRMRPGNRRLSRMRRMVWKTSREPKDPRKRWYETATAELRGMSQSGRRDAPAAADELSR